VLGRGPVARSVPGSCAATADAAKNG
jgi:hypothetical protein